MQGVNQSGGLPVSAEGEQGGHGFNDQKQPHAKQDYFQAAPGEVEFEDWQPP